MAFRSGILMMAFGFGAFGLGGLGRMDPRLFLSLQGVAVPTVRDGQKPYFQALQDQHAARFPKDSLVRGHQAMKTRQHHNSVRRSTMSLRPDL